MHKIAIAAGALIIGAAAHVSIVAAGGYQGQTGPLQLAVALGLVVGAICIGIAWRERRFVVAWCLVVAMAAGEAYAVINTAERTISSRELTAAPIREAEAKRVLAEARLQSAKTKKDAADAAALTEASKPGCRIECRKLIEGAKADAQREIDDATAGLEAIPAIRSASPLADRLGIAGWTLDLVTAALASIAMNGLGAALVSFGAHGVRRHASGRPQATAETKPQQEIVISPAPSARDQAARFGREMLEPSDETTPVVKLYAAYLDWCKSRDLRPLPAREIGSALDDLFRRSELEIRTIDATPHVCGAQLRKPSRALGSSRDQLRRSAHRERRTEDAVAAHCLVKRSSAR